MNQDYVDGWQEILMEPQNPKEQQVTRAVHQAGENDLNEDQITSLSELVEDGSVIAIAAEDDLFDFEEC